MGRNKRILFTGIAGTDKKKYLNNIFGFYPFSIEDKAISGPSKNPIWVEEDPEKRCKMLKHSWKKVKDNDKDIITFHCVWWRPSGFLYDQFQMADFIKKEIAPDYLIVLLNNITDTRWYLQIKAEEGDELASKIGFRDIIIWRANEINISKLLSQYIWGTDFRDHFYVIATGHPKETIEDLINSNKPRAYCAFPIRKLAEQDDVEEIRNIKNNFFPIISKHCVAFNPYAIYEKEIERLLINPDPERIAEVYTLKTLGKILSQNLFEKPFFPTDRKPKWFSLTLWEIVQVIRDINAQLVERDKMMVQQSDFVVAYRPVLSEGAQQELRWSILFNREAYAIMPEYERSAWEKLAKKLFETDLRHITILENFLELEDKIKKISRNNRRT